ncbi:MAG: hypothetical protein IJZ33_02285 [Clostridia bacterium]|nr:hypothetical protein [Clostridia bacterium]
MKREFRLFCVLLLVLALVLSSCAVPAASTDRQSPSLSEDGVWDFVIAHFQTAQELARWIYPDGLGASEAELYCKAGYLMQLFDAIECGRAFVYDLTLTNGSSPLVKNGAAVLNYQTFPTIRYDCKTKGKGYSVKVRYNVNKEPEADFLASCLQRWGHIGDENFEIVEESLSFSGKTVKAARVTDLESGSQTLFLSYDRNVVVEFRNYGGSPFSQAQLSKLRMKPLFPGALLGSTDEKTGKNGFFDIGVCGIDELILAEKELSDEELEAFLAGSDGRFSYAEGGIKTREDVTALLAALEEQKVFHSTECDEYGLMYFGDTKRIRTYYRLGGLNVQFDYLTTVEQLEEAYRVVEGSEDYTHRKGGVYWKEYPMWEWFHCESEGAYILLYEGLMITVTGEDVAHFEEKERNRWFRETVADKFHLVSDRAQFE